MSEPGARRLAVLTEGRFGTTDAKTAAGVIRYARESVAVVIDSSAVGRSVAAWLPGHDIPVVASLEAALALADPPTAPPAQPDGEPSSSRPGRPVP